MIRTELDYYAVLNVPRSATKNEITLSYRKLALRLCPFRDPKHDRDFIQLSDETELTHMTPLSLNRQWDYINMAYDVLGNELYRSIYDRFGEAGLFEGIMLPNGYFPPYQYHGDNLKVYHEVFGTYSPYANTIDSITNPPVLYTTHENGIGVRIKDAPVEKTIFLELEEVRFGSVKLMQVWREEFCNADKTMTEKRKKTLKLNIAPGTTAGTRFCFKEEGDRSPTKIPGDIIFIAEDKPHRSFCRSQNQPEDLVYHKPIDLCQALAGFRFVIETLDKRKLKVCINDVVYPGFTKVIPCEGLPKCMVTDGASALKSNKSKEYGDLIIEFCIQFPDYLTRNMKSFCRHFFANLEELKDQEDQHANPTFNSSKKIHN